MKYSIGFDVYGTLVDPVDMGQHLENLIGDRASEFGQLWHDKKVEYAFRRGLMQQYADFTVCTHQALQYCLNVYQISLSPAEQQQLMARFAELNAFDDVIPGLKKLVQHGHHLAAFSNGPELSVRKLMANSHILPHLQQVVSVDDLQTYKPNPDVYQYLVERLQADINSCMMVSSNPWDVIGAKSAGLKAVWVKRSPSKLFDPWEIQPDLIVSDLIELATLLNT
ncbi:haloacid dehalogenase type II [Shewanella ulleungensis]|jgi:2-haloacid dehalogenase|uniref:(S)-2-haloacid dehalogenase n=1 Tax=Shewanella ulleungensis TaxID=2282699 RepID=A0ABQ2QDH0_9GAMM|nr:haloacid dehalogenase type II [Shewanella ulleungensis]MCL1148951.1 haloacid dehalogenase type II [Shewanella ulleungensis]GGP74592.1 haloacid dehalogenase [Shewanella ulleungensis]